MHFSEINIGKKIMWGLNILWFIIVILIFLTPYLASVDSPATKYLFFLFRPTCHQMPQRSLFIFDHQMPVCARCTGIYLALASTGIVLSILLYLTTIKPLPIWIFLLFLLPLAIDGGTQLIGLRQSTNIIRLLTGSLAGIGTIWFIYPRIWELDEEY